MKDSRISRGAVEGGTKRALLLIGAASLAFCITGCAGFVSGSKSVPPSGNSTSPTVEITAPASGATESGSVTVSASATGKVAVASVQFQLDGANVGSPLTASPYTYAWDTTKSSNGTHTLGASAKDVDGNVGTSPNVTITVKNSAPDTSPPTVSIIAPANGATVSGTLAVSANANDNVAVASVQFRMDGNNVGPTVTSAPYTYSLNTATLSNSSHALTAVAKDTSGNAATSAAVTIIVNNGPGTTPPTVSIVSPANGATVSSTITSTANASSSVGIASVQFQIDGSSLGATDKTAPYITSLDTTTLVNGNHTLTAVATDNSNNKAASAPVSINVQNSAPPNKPTVSITSPLAGTIVSKTITVTAAASDSQGIANVQFQVDGSNLGTADTSSPYSQSWDTTKIADGTYVLTAVATSNDSTQQPASASAVVTVNNSGTGPVLSATPGWHKIPGTALCGGPENTTLSVPDNFPSNLNSNYASFGFSFSTTCGSGFEDSSGAVVDTTRNRIIFWQGGHIGYWGNDVFDFEANNIGTGNPVLLRLDNPANPHNPVGSANTIETLAACNYVAGCTPTTNSPGSRHTYGNLVYIPSTDQMTSFGGGLTPQGNASSELWTLNMSSVLQSCAPTATNQPGCNPVWTNKTPGSAPPGGQVNFINYDPNIGQVWGIYGTNSIWLYNPANNTYSQHGSLSTGYHNYSVLDPVHKLFITAGSDGIHYFDVSNPANTDITFQSSAATGCSLLTGGNAGTDGQYPGMVWDPVAQQVVAYPNGGNALVILDPTTWTCTTETYGSTQGTDYPQNTVMLSGDTGTFGHFQYISAYDIFVLCNDPSKDCWYLRRSR
jgi:hypothetical protein